MMTSNDADREIRLKRVLDSLGGLTYLQREIFLLRTGLRDGYWYTPQEVGHIFKTSAKIVEQQLQVAIAYIAENQIELGSEPSIGEIQVRSVVETAKHLTPYLVAHLKNRPSDLRLLHWRVFEHLVAEFFASSGYSDVRLVGQTGKTAADIFAMKTIEPDGTEVRIFVEVKRWKDKVGVEVVDRVYGAMLAEKLTFGWHMAMIVSIGEFSKMEKYTPSQLQMMGISLKDGCDVERWLKDYRFSSTGLWIKDQRVNDG